MLEFTKIANSLAPELAKTHVYLWDLGPQKPVRPNKPPLPKGKEGEPEYDIAMVDFKLALDEYQAALADYNRGLKDYRQWEKNEGGPIERMMWSCDANDAMERDPKRYVISSSTRGYEKLPNSGLPEGQKPGKGHFANIERIRAGEADMQAVRRSDPVFGQQELRA